MALLGAFRGQDGPRESAGLAGAWRGAGLQVERNDRRTGAQGAPADEARARVRQGFLQEQGREPAVARHGGASARVGQQGVGVSGVRAGAKERWITHVGVGGRGGAA